MKITPKEMKMIWSAVLCQYCEFSKKEDDDSKAISTEHNILLKKLQVVLESEKNWHSIQ